MSRFVFAVCGVAAIALGVFLVGRPSPRTAPLADATIAPSTSEVASRNAAAAATGLPPIPLGYRVQIPRLGIDLPIMEGDITRDTVEQQTPENWAFHLPGTALPGRGANSYIYAHARRGMFITLWNAAVGDEVWISTPGGKALRYLVSEVHPRVPYDDVSWASASSTERLTLQTSTGPNPDDPRFIVVAVPG